MPKNLTGFTAWVRAYLYVFPFVFLLFLSCAGAPDIKESRAFQIIEGVPFYPQEAYKCGPVSLAGVLNYWRIGVSPEDVAAEIYSESAKGTLDIDMILYAERKGLKAGQYKGSAEDIKRNIDLGYPVIVLVDYGFWLYQQNHFMVVVGYNKNGIFTNSGRDRLKFIPFNVFLKLWKRTNFSTMLISPKQ